MARVLLLTPNFYPEKTGIGVSASDCAGFLCRLGHEVDVVTSVPYYPEWKVPEQYRGQLKYVDHINGSRVTRLARYVPENPSFAKRVAHELSFMIHILVRCIFWRADLVICISPPLVLAFVMAVVFKLRRKSYWVYVQDIQPDAAIDLKMLRSRFLIQMLRAMELTTYRLAEKVLVLSEGMRKNISRKLSRLGDGSEDKIAVIPLAVDVSELDVGSDIDRKATKFRQKHNLSSNYLVVYSGNLGVKQDPCIIAECAKLMQNDREIFFAIVGDGAKRQELAELIERYQLTNIKLFPLVERSELADLLASADVLLAPQRKEIVDIFLPSKLISYLCSRRPVIASALETSGAAQLLNEQSAGVVVEPEKPEAIVNAIRVLKQNPDLAISLGERGYQFVCQTFDNSAVLERYYRPLFAEITAAQENCL